MGYTVHRVKESDTTERLCMQTLRFEEVVLIAHSLDVAEANDWMLLTELKLAQ